MIFTRPRSLRLAPIENDSSDSATVLTAPGSAPTIVDEEVPPPKSPQAFLCLEFKEEISNNSSADEKAAEEHRFYRRVWKKFNDSGLSHFDYLERLPDNEERARFRTAVSKAFGCKSPAGCCTGARHGDFGKEREMSCTGFSKLNRGDCLEHIGSYTKIDQEKQHLPKQKTNV